MIIKATNARASIDLNGTMTLTIDVDKEHKNAVRNALSTLKDILLSVEIKKFRAKRSHNSNAYFWVICEQMADVLNTSKDEQYLELLSRYGVFTHILVKPAVVERVKAEWRTVRELGEVTVNGMTGIQLQCYFGSSTYNSKEMSRLLQGTIDEAKDMGIETLTPTELARLNEEWGKHEKHNAK